MHTSQPLDPDDRVFLFGDEVYTIIRNGMQLFAHKVFRSDGGYTRSNIPTGLAPALINGVVHQREDFPASRLDEFWPRSTPSVRQLTDTMDLFSAEAAKLQRRSARAVKSQ